jgi:membrane-associated protein
VFESLTDTVLDSGWVYPGIFAVAALDAILPFVPSETIAIGAGVAASNGDLTLWLVILVAATGAIVGDNASYWIGRTVGHRIMERFFGAKHQARIDQLETSLAERGGYFIIIGRFIPGGRIVVTFGSGTLEYPWRRFFTFDVIAGFLWASYAALLGYFGGKAFEDNPLKGFALAFGIALAVTGLIEAIRWIRRRRAGPADA